MSAAAPAATAASPLRLHPFVHVLEDRRPGAEDRRGLFHTLTGDCLQIGTDLLSQVLCGRSSPEAAAATEVLGEWGLLVGAAEARDPARLLAPLLQRQLSIPAHTPTLASVRADTTLLYRPQGLSCCRLPRDARVPRVVREQIDPRCGALLQSAEHQHPLGEAMDRLGLDPATALRLLAVLADPERQTIRLAAGTTAEADLRSQHHYPMQHFEPTGAIEPAAHHYEAGIVDAQFNFDWLEPTVAHAFRRPTAALDGRAYGAALFAAVEPWRALHEGICRVLEIGGGTGELALAFLQAARSAGAADRIEYHILDRSPALLAAQRERLHAHGFEPILRQGDAQRALPQGAHFDLVLVNEVISDFEVSDGQQIGARAFLQLLPTVLAPGGQALLIEYGALAAAPTRVEHLGHEEYSIDFGDLRDAAPAAGLGAEVLSLGALLGARWDTPMLVGQQERHLCLHAAFADHGASFESRVYDRDGFLQHYGELCRHLGLMRLSFSPLHEGHQFGPDLRQFLALRLMHAGAAPGHRRGEYA